MSNKSILEQIIALSAQLKPDGDKPFNNEVFVAASTMLASTKAPIG